MSRGVVLLRSATKTFLAGLLALLAARSLGLVPGWFAVVGSLLVMQASLGGSVRAAVARVAGTALGALTGVAFEATLGDGVVSVALAAAAAGVLVSLMGLEEAVRVGTVTAPIVMLAPGPDTVPLFLPGPESAALGLERTLETVLGALVGIGVAFTVWPAPARATLRNLLADGIGDLRIILDLVTGPLRGAPPPLEGDPVEVARERYRVRLGRARQLLQELKGEPPAQAGDAGLATILELERRVLTQISACEEALRQFAGQDDPLKAHLLPFLEALARSEAATLEDLERSVREVRAPQPPTDLEAAEGALQEAVAEGRRRNLPRESPPERVLEVLGAVHVMLQVSERILGQHSAVEAWVSTQERRR